MGAFCSVCLTNNDSRQQSYAPVLSVETKDLRVGVVENALHNSPLIIANEVITVSTQVEEVLKLDSHIEKTVPLNEIKSQDDLINKTSGSDTEELKTKKRVLVIGAGVSGLAAATTLHSAGFDVTVIEGRDRIGGRIHTDHTLFGCPIEIGAQFIHGLHKDDGDLNPIYSLLLTQKWKFIPYFADSAQYQQNGKRVDDTYILSIFDQFYDFVTNSIKPSLTDVNYSMTSALQAFKEDQGLSETQYKLLLSIVASDIEGEFGGNIYETSMMGYDEEGWFEGGDHIMTGGYDQLPNYLASTLPQHAVRLSEKVVSIHYGGVSSPTSTTDTFPSSCCDSSPCLVTTASGRSFSADYVISTLPLGVLQSHTVAFSPELPLQKQTVIERMGNGLLDKIIMKFPKKFWTTGANWIKIPFPAQSDFSFTDMEAIIPGQNVLVLWHWGEEARKHEQMSDAMLLEQLAMPALRQTFGANVVEPSAMFATRWHMDPFARGGYSFIKTGSSKLDIIELARPVANRLFFAGEATEIAFWQTVHGAYMSGVREAKNIMRLSGKFSSSNNSSSQ